jgi:hypothetical protein
MTELIKIKSVDDRENISLSSSIDDENRKELPWEYTEEKLLLTWCHDSKKRSARHYIGGNRNKIKFAVFGVPSILIPIILGGVAPVVGCNSMIYSIGMMGAGIFSGMNLFFNFGKKQQEHFDYMNKFGEFSNEIESELSKPKRFRVACDVYIERMKLKYNSLCDQSPII